MQSGVESRPPTEAAMLFLDLPFDVLSLVLDIVERGDALQLAQASRRAYDLAMPHILSSVAFGENRLAGMRFGPTPPPLMNGARQLSAFTTFLLSDIRRWPPHIHSLTMHPTTFGCPPQPGRLFSLRDYSGGHLFAEALRNAHNLQTLDIGDVEVLLFQCPSFDSVLCEFACLKHVKFSGLGPFSAALLKKLRSRPRNIELLGVGTHIQAILHSLRPHGCTLEVLALGGYAPPLSTMAKAFPNVRIGRFHNFRMSWNAAKAFEWVEWPSLDTIEISALLPLASPVRHVRLGAGLILNPHTPSETVSCLLAILQRTRPVVLSFTISGTPPGFFDGLVAEVRSVQYLEMTRINTLNDNTGLFLADALSGICGLPLLAVGLGRVRGIEPSVSDMDAGAAAMIADMLPTVRFISSFVDSKSSDGESDCNNRRWFRVTSKPSDTHRHVEEVPRQEVGGITSFLESLDREGG